MKELNYPFDAEYILKKKKSLRRELIAEAEAANKKLLKKNIAVLGGSTTHDIIKVLDLFLLNEGIEATFYESEYNQYYQDAMFGNEELNNFKPDIIYIHTTSKNITSFPEIKDSPEDVRAKEDAEFNKYKGMWEHLKATYSCPVIQNNFEYPSYRLLGNRDCYDIHGHVAFINRLNQRFCEYAESHDSIYLHDINYQAASYGIDNWYDPFYYHMYKYALSMNAIPEFAFSLSHIIKAIFGKNKKAFALDLDNTLWGGIVGDDGPENLEIGQETSLGQVYQEFQKYLKAHKDIGVLLNVDSKNEEANAIAGLEHPEGILKPDDFIVIKANWDPKSINLQNIAKTLNIGVDSIVFVDDNPAEREIIRQQVSDAAVPSMTADEVVRPDKYIRILDKNGYFEVISLSEDDAKRNEMYKANAERATAEASFENYEDFLKSLEMKAVIKPFEPMYYSRIAQLTNKSNQFNLTTLRLSQAEIEAMASDPKYLTLYGKLADKFGDNGVVSLLIGEIESNILHMRLWLMSCRVLKRDMEQAMMDTLVSTCRAHDISSIRGYYYPTAKNAMVKEFYLGMGFNKISEDSEGNTIWEFNITEDYKNQNRVIEVN